MKGPIYSLSASVSVVGDPDLGESPAVTNWMTEKSLWSGLTEMAGNPLSRVLGKVIHGEVSHWRRATEKLPERVLATGHWELVVVGDYLYAVEAMCWRRHPWGHNAGLCRWQTRHAAVALAESPGVNPGC